FGIFFGKDGVTVATQAYDLGLTKKYKWAGDGAIAESTNLIAIGNKIDGFIGINRYIPVLQGPLDTPYHRRFFDEAKKRLAKIDPSGPLPDRYVQSNYESINAVKLGMENSKFQGRDDTMNLIKFDFERSERIRDSICERGGRPIGPPSPTPLTPSGLSGDGECWWIRCKVGKSRAVGSM